METDDRHELHESDDVEDTIKLHELGEGKRLNHPGMGSVAAVFQGPGVVQGNKAYTVITEEGDVLEVVPHGERCDCGTNETYSPRMGTPVDTRRNERAEANCEHASIALECEDLGQCECGTWAIDKKAHSDEIGNVLVEEIYCSECGEYRGC